MTNTYLVEIIKALQPNKRQELTLFLSSALFSRGKNAKEIERLYQIILESAPTFSEELLNKDQISIKIYGEPNTVSGRMEKLIADLNKLVRIFALQQLYLSESNEVHQQIDWAKWLRMSGMADLSQKVIVKLKNKKTSENLESLEQFQINFLTAFEEHEWELTFNQVKSDLNIPNLIHHLDLYYHNYRMELANRYLLQQKATYLPNLDFSKSNLEIYETESARLQISHKIYNLLNKNVPTSEEIQSLIQLLQSKEACLSFQTLDHFYAYLRNFCTLLLNNGDLEIIPILHQINKDNLKRGYFFLFGKIPPHPYLNLVQIAIKAGEYDWAKHFTESYKKLIVGGDSGQFFYRLNMAQCFFAAGDFDKALDHLPEAPSSAHYHHMVRRLEIKIYYELNSDLLLYKVDAFRKFIQRTAPKNISPSLRSMDLNFLNILMQLSQSPLKDKSRSSLLITRIEAKKLLADRAWLLEKARELG